jgi:glycolate oxidase iron-sulfur subunit
VQLPVQENAPANGPSGASARRVLVLDGCVQQAATPGVNVALRHLLGTQSVEVVSLPGEGCCGALQYHLADHEGGETRMRRMIDRLLPILDDYEYIVSSASGCGVTLKDYPRILAHDPAYADKATTVASKIVDVSELLTDMQFDCEPAQVAFHSPCTLQHGQKLNGAVEEILRKAGMNLVPVRDAHLCCGSAGTYSIMQPELSDQLRANKIAALQAEQPEFIVSANIGCQLHLDAEANSTVLHWVELLALRLKS